MHDIMKARLKHRYRRLEPCAGVWIPTIDELDFPTGGKFVCFINEFKYSGDYIISTDHILPSSMGGTDIPENLHQVHFGCQSRQGGRLGHRLQRIQARRRPRPRSR